MPNKTACACECGRAAAAQMAPQYPSPSLQHLLHCKTMTRVALFLPANAISNIMYILHVKRHTHTVDLVTFFLLRIAPSARSRHSTFSRMLECLTVQSASKYAALNRNRSAASVAAL